MAQVQASRLSAQQFQRCVDSWAAQVFVGGLVASHCVFYYQELELLAEGRHEEAEHRFALVLGTGVPMLLAITGETLVRTAAQSGPLCHLASWRRMLTPHYHKLQALLLFGIVYRVIASFFFLSSARRGERSLDSQFLSTEKATVLILVYHRIVHAWGIYFKVSVQATERQRRALENPTIHWWAEHVEMKEAYNARMFVRLQRHSGTKIAQITMLTLVMMHCGLYALTRSPRFPLYEDVKGTYWVTKYTGYFLVLIFFLEFFVRCCAQGGERFFAPILQRLEFVFMLLGMMLVFYSAWFHTSIRESRATFEPAGTGTGAVLIVHRLLRGIGIRFEVSGSDFHSMEVWDAQVAKYFTAKLGDIIEVPPQNVSVKMQVNVFVRILKARIKPDVLRTLHLPVVVQGGVIEELYISIKGPGRLLLGRKESDATELRVHGLLLLLGPGPGLAEAGGFSPRGTYWDYQSVLEAKSRLIDLICRQLSPPSGAPDLAGADEQLMAATTFSGSALGASGSVTPEFDSSRTYAETPRRKRSFRAFIASMKNRWKALAMEIYLQKVKVEISRITLQFEDDCELLGQGHMAVGLSLGKASLEWVDGKHLNCNVTRFGVYVQTRVLSTASHALNSIGTSKSQTWRTRLARLLEQHPASALKELVRLDVAERFRRWAFDELSRKTPMMDRQRHLRSEKWPEHKLVFSCLNWKLQAEKHRCAKRPSRLAMERGGSGSGFFPPSPSSGGGWKVRLDTRPLNVSADDEQVRCLRTIFASVNSWMLHDNAFHWRPDLSLSDAVLAVKGGIWDEQLVRTLAQQWWVYAVHRVLATRRMRPRMPWASLLSYASHVHRYSTVLADIVARVNDRQRHKPADEGDAAGLPVIDYASRNACPLVGGLLRPTAPERQELLELQVRLPLSDIVSCWKRALADAVKLQRIVSNVSSNEYSRDSTRSSLLAYRDWILNYDYRSEGRRTYFAQAHETAIDVATDLSNGRLQAGAETLIDSAHQARLEAARVAGKVLVTAADCTETVVSTLPEEAMRQTEQTRLKVVSIMRGSGSHTTGEAQDEDEARADLRNQAGSRSNVTAITNDTHASDSLLDIIAGEWEIYVPMVEVRLLCWQAPPRPVLLHAKVIGILLEAQSCEPEEKSFKSSRNRRPSSSSSTEAPNNTSATRPSEGVDLTIRSGFSEGLLDDAPEAGWTAVLVVEAFCAKSPEAPNLFSLAQGRQICSVTEYIEVPPAPPKLMPGNKVGESAAFVLRAARSAIGERGTLQVVLPNIRVMLYEPLVLALFAYFGKDQVSGVMSFQTKIQRDTMTDFTASRSVSGSTHRNMNFGRLRNAGGTSLGIDSESVAVCDRGGLLEGTRKLLARNGRVGPFSDRVTVDIDPRATNELTSSWCKQFRTRMNAVHALRLFAKQVARRCRTFEFLVGLQGDPADWSVQADVGAIHATQVGRYSELTVFVEDYRLWPFSVNFNRGTKEDSETEVHGGSLRRRWAGAHDESFASAAARGCLLPWDLASWTDISGLQRCLWEALDDGVSLVAKEREAVENSYRPPLLTSDVAAAWFQGGAEAGSLEVTCRTLPRRALKGGLLEQEGAKWRASMRARRRL